VFNLDVDYRIGRYEARTKLIQPAPVTVDPAPFAFKEARSLDAASILGRLTIVGGDQFEDAGDRVVLHNQEGSSAPGQLTMRTLPRMVQVGEDANGNPIFEQDEDNGVPLTDTFLSLEGAGLGINPAGQTALDTNTYFGVELDGIENVEVRLADGNDQFTIDEVPDATRVTVASGGGVDTVNVREVGAETRILTGAGDDFVNVNAGGSLANIDGRLFIDGDAHILEQQIPFAEDDFGADVIAFVPQVFVNTDPNLPGTREFNGTRYRLPELAPIVEKIPGNLNKELRVRVVVLDATGAVQEDFIQTMGVPEFGKQKLDGSNPLFFDDEGRETVNPGLTGVPVIMTVAADDPAALPVYVDAAGNKRLEASTLADDDDLDNDGDTLTDEPGERAQNFRSFITDFENGSLLYVTTTGALTDKLPSVLAYNMAGPDFNLYELGADEFSSITVHASVDGTSWFGVSQVATVRIAGDGSADHVRSYDLGGLAFARYIRVSQGGAPGEEFDGFDLDALGIHPGHEGGEGAVFAEALDFNSSGGPDSTFVGAPDDLARGLRGRQVVFSAATQVDAPSLLRVNRVTAIAWVETVDAETALPGSDTINVVNTGDDSDVAAIIDAFQIAMNDLVNGRPAFHPGADAPVQQFHFGGEPVIDPFTFELLFYAGGEPMFDLFTGDPVLDPFGNQLTHKAGDPVLHSFGDPVVHAHGAFQRYLGGELTLDENGNLVFNPVRVTQDPTLVFADNGALPDTITRLSGNWKLDQFAVGDKIHVAGTAANDTAGHSFYTIAAISEDSRTVTLSAADALVDETYSGQNAEIRQLFLHLPDSRWSTSAAAAPTT
jgi:hypothetical protein